MKELLLYWKAAKSRTNIFENPYFLWNNPIKDELHTFISLSDLFEKLLQSYIFIQSYNQEVKRLSFHHFLKSAIVICALA